RGRHASCVSDWSADVCSSDLANDSDPDGDALSVTAISNQSPVAGTSGTLSIGGGGANIIFTPKAGFVGTVTFDYTLSDGTATDRSEERRVGKESRAGWALAEK